ncbi:hypothetical protein [Tenacibaculum holothuriorum]|uniref:hypothetical protein n=1 Tax=Tenacibaculum holothuriorum TaxID=1635173 RepID=UPI0013028F5D|nr:hypothetical protein [Tenacibaculum holothuriorum]
MIITRDFAEALIGMDMKKASWILDKLSGTGFDYPEMQIEALEEAYESKKN